MPHRAAATLCRLLLVTSLTACGTEPASEARIEGDSTDVRTADSGDTAVDGAPDANDDATRDAGAATVCRTDDDCPDGWCVGPPGCDTEWRCVTEQPCSAVAPSSACTCNGEWVELPAGCPGEQYAFSDPQLPPRFLGTSCEPTLPPPTRVTLEFQGFGFDDLNGQNISAVFIDSVIGRNEPVQTTRIGRGAFFLRWDSSFDLNSFGYFIRTWVDDGDGQCEPDEPVSEWFASNAFGGADPLIVTVSPADASPGVCP
jgi:hypothetical protein